MKTIYAQRVDVIVCCNNCDRRSAIKLRRRSPMTANLGVRAEIEQIVKRLAKE